MRQTGVRLLVMLVGLLLGAERAMADSEFVFFNAASCPSPPCTSVKRGAVAGHKTVSVKVVGTGTAQVMCLTSSVVAPVALFTQTGAGADQVEFDTACLELYTTITACAGGCTTTAAVVVVH